MRTHEFEFKKTVKRSEKFKAISVDLTVEDAKNLLVMVKRFPNFHNLAQATLLDELQENLEAFLAKNGVYVE